MLKNPSVVITRVKIYLVVENRSLFSIFPEACIRGALGYYLYSRVHDLQEWNQGAQAHKFERLYECLLGDFPDKEPTNKAATLPRRGMLFCTNDLNRSDGMFLEVTFFGRENDLVPILLESLQILGADGIGSHRLRFFVDRVISEQCGDIGEFVSEKKYEPEIRLSFVSPTMLRAKGGDFISTWNTEAFFRNLAQRLNQICELQNENRLYDIESNSFESSYRFIETAINVKYSNRMRMSSRQHKRLDCSGFIGHVSLKNVNEELWELICLGEILGVGKNTVFGGGRYFLTKK